jgi:hypothetical protein
MLGIIEIALAFAVVMVGISLIITVLVQMVSALLSSRGANLRWGIKTLFQEIDPKGYPTLAANAQKLSETVLTHCLLSDSVLSSWRTGPLTRRLQLASAIRADELVAILNDIAADPGRHGLPDGIANELASLLTAQNPVAQRAITLVRSVVPEATEAAVRTIEQARGKLEGWFNSMMDRVSQRFTMHMRLWTVGLAILISILFRVDSLRIMKDLTANTAARQALAGAAPAMIAAADGILGETPAIHSNSLRQAMAEAGLAEPPVPEDVKTYSESDRWIQANVPEERRPAVFEAYKRRSDSALRAYIADRTERGEAVRALLGGTEIRIVPSPFPAWNEIGADTSLIGLILSAALLSLGAPFWFNTLKGLTNLRPVVAQKDSREKPAQR